MRVTKNQLRRIIREAIEDPKGALAAAQEMGYSLNIPITVDSNQIAIDDALAGYPGEFTYDDIAAAVASADVPLYESYGSIGSGDPAQEILDWAEEGNRVTVAGKNIWAGLGSRAGLHSYADEVINDKWYKSGERFTKKVMNLPAGTEVELKRFQSSSRGRGNWVTAGTVTTLGPVTGSGAGGEVPKAKRMREIFQDLSMMYDRDIGKKHLKSISLYQGSDNPWGSDKVWEIQVGKDKMLFQDRTASEYAEWENGAWELYNPY